MIYLLLVFVFLLAMAGLVIFLERYAKYCKKNNIEVVEHSDWLFDVGMRETYHMINRRWKTPF